MKKQLEKKCIDCGKEAVISNPHDFCGYHWANWHAEELLSETSYTVDQKQKIIEHLMSVQVILSEKKK